MNIERLQEVMKLHNRLKRMKNIEENLERHKGNDYMIAFMESRGEEVCKYLLPESMRPGIMELVKEEINVITRKIKEL